MAGAFAQALGMFLVLMGLGVQLGSVAPISTSHILATFDAPADASDDTDSAPLVAVESPDDSQTFEREFRVTAYCDRGLTAAGVPSGVGQCAAPGDIPLGSIIYIPQLDRRFVVTDRTHKRFRHNTVDIFMPERDECLQFGRKYLTGKVTLPEKKHKYGNSEILASIASSEL